MVGEIGFVPVIAAKKSWWICSSIPAALIASSSGPLSPSVPALATPLA